MAAEAPRPSLVRRLLDRVVAPYLEDLRTTVRSEAGRIDVHDDLGELRERQENLGALAERLQQDLGRVHRELEEATGRTRQIQTEAERAAAIGRHVYDDEVGNRRRLRALRESDDYEAAFTEAEPLVSFVVPTYTSYETLRDVALPSILGQSYENLEVIVVGDTAPPQTAEAVAALGDERVSYFNRTVRGPYPEDPDRRWYVIGSPPITEGVARARGRWIAILGDDDAVRPHHTESLLSAAREDHLEHCYGKQQINFTGGESITIGVFPPRLGEWGLQAALYHRGLGFIEAELTDAIFSEPNDWSMCRRMLRAGVSTGMIDSVVVDKFETRRASAAEWRSGPVPEVE